MSADVEAKQEEVPQVIFSADTPATEPAGIEKAEEKENEPSPSRQQEALFVQHINRSNSAETRREIERLQRELDAMRWRDTELSALFKRLYEDNVLGKVTNEQFRMLSVDYNSEQNSLTERIPQAVERIEKMQSSIANVARFVEKAKRYTEINELNGELLNLFIERIEVGEREERYSRIAEQTIIIHYRDIGVLGAFAEEAQKIAG